MAAMVSQFKRMPGVRYPRNPIAITATKSDQPVKRHAKRVLGTWTSVGDWVNRSGEGDTVNSCDLARLNRSLWLRQRLFTDR